MGQNSYKLPSDVKAACISYVKGYKRRLEEYRLKREEVLTAGRSPSFGEIRGSRGEGRWGDDDTFDRAARLRKIEEHFDTRIMRAVEQASVGVGEGWPDEDGRRRLLEAIVECCTLGRGFIFRYYNIDGKEGEPLSKSAFYRYYNKFLYDIAARLTGA